MYICVYVNIYIQGQVGWGFEHPDLVEGVPAHDRGVGAR